MSSVRIDIDIERRHTAASAMRELDEMGGVKQDHQAGSGGIIDQDLKIQNLYDLNHARSCYSVYNTKVKCKGACDQRGNEGMTMHDQRRMARHAFVSPTSPKL
jgi:hypothetical protein